MVSPICVSVVATACLKKELGKKTGGRLCALTCWSYIDTLVSGSPIIQNGKLVGAVTHVLVDDPTRGYAIFAENMFATAQSVTEAPLSKAS